MDGRERKLARYSTKGAGVVGKGVLLLIKKLMVFVGVPIFAMGIFLLVLTAGVETEISSMTAVLSNQKSSTSEEAAPDEEISAGAMKDARTSYPKAGNTTHGYSLGRNQDTIIVHGMPLGGLAKY